MFFLVTALVFAAPQAESAGPAGRLAVAWVDDEVEVSLRETLRELLAQRGGTVPQRLRDEALEDARQAVTLQQPRALAQLHTQLRDELDAADLGYREGGFEHASERLREVLALLHAQPELPGAAASAREAHLLAAKIAWAQGESERAEASLGAALRLDPEARLSTRSAPPALVERYIVLQARARAQRAEGGWITPTLVWTGQPPDAGSFELEIDGVDGLRPLPIGPHFVVLRREGYAPVSSWVERDTPWVFDEMVPIVAAELARAGPAICSALGLEVLVIADQRDAQIGLQVLACASSSFGALWVGPREQLEQGVDEVLGGPFMAAEASVFEVWPIAASAPLLSEDGDGGRGALEVPRPWYRKGWIWGTSAGAFALTGGAIAAGILLSGAAGPRAVEIDAKDFIGAR